MLYVTNRLEKYVEGQHLSAFHLFILLSRLGNQHSLTFMISTAKYNVWWT